MQNKYYFALMAIIIICMFTGCVSASGQIKKLMDNNIEIQSVDEIWGWDTTGSDFSQSLALDIKLKDNKRLFLGYIRSTNLFPDFGNITLLKAPFSVYLVGDNVFTCFELTYSSDGEHINNTVGHGLPTALLAQQLKIKLETVEDVVKNYDKIYAFVSSFPKYRKGWIEDEQPMRIIFTDRWDAEKNYYTSWEIRRFVQSDDKNQDKFEDFDKTYPTMIRRVHTRNQRKTAGTTTVATTRLGMKNSSEIK
ncbi:hypothetical protein FACS1894130_12180 [Spirochaetia bacterium]|nr:hypothetical protein FACS1894130_12180 [Spirochaetia bacterium]